MGNRQVKPQHAIPPVKVRRNTGLRIPRRKANAILHALANGRSVRSICKEFKTGHHAVMALKVNRAEDYQKVRMQLRDEWATLAAIGTSELLERVGDMDIRTLSVAAGVSTDKAMLLEGGPGVEQEPPVQQPAVEDWGRYVAGLHAATDASEPSPAGPPQGA
jgi:hypothetical protein